jgi:Na+-driven multidrug efflux pump
MLITIGVQWLVFLPLAYLIGPVSGLGLTAIWLLQVGYRLLQSGIFTYFWVRRGWAGIVV